MGVIMYNSSISEDLITEHNSALPKKSKVKFRNNKLHWDGNPP